MTTGCVGGRELARVPWSVTSDAEVVAQRVCAARCRRSKEVLASLGLRKTEFGCADDKLDFFTTWIVGATTHRRALEAPSNTGPPRAHIFSVLQRLHSPGTTTTRPTANGLLAPRAGFRVVILKVVVQRLRVLRTALCAIPRVRRCVCVHAAATHTVGQHCATARVIPQQAGLVLRTHLHKAVAYALWPMQCGLCRGTGVARQGGLPCPAGETVSRFPARKREKVICDFRRIGEPPRFSATSNTNA